MHQNPTLTFTLALVAGMLAQAVAQHLRIPGIVVLLLTGALLGPEALGIVRPSVLGGFLPLLVGLSVAVILFEGALNLNLVHLRREARVIRRLVSIGAVVTAVGATIAARMILEWPWPIAVLFGTLVIVTGPTVITPLLRRIRVTRSVSTILEAEGVLIDPIGAIIAVVALEIVLELEQGFATQHLIGLPARLVIGALIGLAGGAVIALALRWERVLPEGMENTFTLALVLALFTISDSLQAESGLMAATIAGLVVGNVHSRAANELRLFKEQITVLLVGLLFVLLAADVRLVEVLHLGWRGVLVVVVLMAVVRPLDVLVCTWRTGLSWRERAFMSWLGPRGIVAAAVASVFAERLTETGFAVGAELRALVFLVIAITVVVQGLTGGWVAERLGVRLPSERGYLVVGANPVGSALAASLRTANEDVVVIDTNESDVRAARAAGLTVLHGDAFDEEVLLEADVEGRRGVIAVTSNEGANLLLAQRIRRMHRVPLAYVALSRTKTTVSPDRAREAGTRVLFGGAVDLTTWSAALRQGTARVQTWRYTDRTEQSLEAAISQAPAGAGGVLPLLVRRGPQVLPVDGRVLLRSNDEVTFLTTAGDGSEAEQAADAPWSTIPSASAAGRERTG